MGRSDDWRMVCAGIRTDIAADRIVSRFGWYSHGEGDLLVEAMANREASSRTSSPVFPTPDTPPSTSALRVPDGPIPAK